MCVLCVVHALWVHCRVCSHVCMCGAQGEQVWPEEDSVGQRGSEEQLAPWVLSDASEKKALKTQDFTEGDEGQKEKNTRTFLLFS